MLQTDFDDSSAYIQALREALQWALDRGGWRLIHGAEKIPDLIDASDMYAAKVSDVRMVITRSDMVGFSIVRPTLHAGDLRSAHPAQAGPTLEGETNSGESPSTRANA